MSTAERREFSFKGIVWIYSLTKESLQNDDAKVKFYTGLQSFATLVAIFRYVSAPVMSGPQTTLTTFQQFLMVLIKLRLNLVDQDIRSIPIWCTSVNRLTKL